MEKLIITLAPTGNVPTRELTPHAPLTNDEIVEDVKKCRELGVSIAHLHVRDEELKPTSNRDRFEDLLKKLEGVDIIRQLSTGARGGGQSLDWRGQMLDLNAEMASLATGSSNFLTSANVNTPELIEYLAKRMRDNNIKPEIEVFDSAMINNALVLHKKGILKGPLHFNLVMNVPGSLVGTPKNLMYLIDSLPEGATFTVSGVGRSQVQMLSLAIALGGHVRTGIEDTLYYEKGVLATNEMLVNRIVNIAKSMGREIASVDEARKILGLNACIPSMG
jgi:3-keto-5-aminohexanoate cleavage enzyme